MPSYINNRYIYIFDFFVCVFVGEKIINQQKHFTDAPYSSNAVYLQYITTTTLLQKY